MNYIDKLKDATQAQSASKKNKIKNLAQVGGKTIDKFALKENEIESIFDILEEECPEL